MPNRQDHQHHFDAIHQAPAGKRQAGEVAALIEQQRAHIADLIALGRDTQRAELLLSEMQRTLADMVVGNSWDGLRAAFRTRQPKQRD